MRASATVLRTNFIGKNKANNLESLTDWVFNSLKNKEKITVFKDIYFNPLNINTLCEIIEKIMGKKKKGIYNLGSNGSISKAEIAMQIVNKFNFSNKQIIIGKRSDINTDAKRPLNMLMKTEKFQNDFEINLPSVYAELEKTIEEYL